MEDLGFTFSQLRTATRSKLPQIEGLVGSWGLAQWCNSLTAQVGRLAASIEREARGRPDHEAVALSAFAAAVVHLDVLAEVAQVNLGRATFLKFNEVSVRVGCDVRLVGRPEDLAFSSLRHANKARLPLFKNAQGGPAHSEPDGSDWCRAQWCNAVTGELGEAANLIKKIERGDFSLDEARDDLGRELADIMGYLDIMAFRFGIDLGAVAGAASLEMGALRGLYVEAPVGLGRAFA